MLLAVSKLSLTEQAHAHTGRYLARLYRSSSRELTRLESVSRAPMVSMVERGVVMRATTRAFGCNAAFIDQGQTMGMTFLFFPPLYISLKLLARASPATLCLLFVPW